jgi:hypothetical protein
MFRRKGTCCERPELFFTPLNDTTKSSHSQHGGVCVYIARKMRKLLAAINALPPERSKMFSFLMILKPETSQARRK